MVARAVHFAVAHIGDSLATTCDIIDHVCVTANRHPVERITVLDGDSFARAPRITLKV